MIIYWDKLKEGPLPLKGTMTLDVTLRKWTCKFLKGGDSFLKTTVTKYKTFVATGCKGNGLTL